MQPLDRTKSRQGDSPRRTGQQRSADIISLDEWRRNHRRPRRRPAPRKPSRIVSLNGDASPEPATPPRRFPVPVEAWLMILVVFSAMAGAVLALMGLGTVP